MITEMASEALSSSPGTGRRERRKAETRARLLAAARRLFAERGFDATRPQDVARAADLAVGTFYVHFADKADVFLAFTEDAAREIMEALRARAEGSRGFEERLRRSLEALLAWSDANPGVLAVCFADAAVLSAGGSAGTSGPGTSVSPRAGSRRAGRTAPRGASLRERFASHLAAGLRLGQTRGELHRDVDPDVVAAGVVGLVQHALMYGREHADRPALVENVTRLCARALVAHAPASADAQAGGGEAPPPPRREPTTVERSPRSDTTVERSPRSERETR